MIGRKLFSRWLYLDGGGSYWVWGIVVFFCACAPPSHQALVEIRHTAQMKKNIFLTAWEKK